MENNTECTEIHSYCFLTVWFKAIEGNVVTTVRDTMARVSTLRTIL